MLFSFCNNSLTNNIFTIPGMQFAKVRLVTLKLSTRYITKMHQYQNYYKKKNLFAKASQIILVLHNRHFADPNNFLIIQLCI